MKENSVKNIHDEMVYYNAKIHATMGEAYRAYEKFSLMYSANENPFHGFHTRSEFFMNASGISAEDPSVIFNECKKIHDKVDDTQYCGYVIDFVNKKHMGMGNEYPFGSCLIKISAEGVDIPYYILADESTLFNSRVFIGEDYKAYLVTQLNKDEFKCLKLSEFHFMSFQSNGKDEYGIFTSWSWFVRKAYSTILKSHSLDPLKCFLLSEWLSSYKKDTIEQKSSIEKRGESNE